MAHGKGSAARNEEIISLFLLDRRLGGCTDATQEAYKYQLRPLQRWCRQRSLDLMSLDEARVQEFLAERLKVSPSTLVAAVTRVRTFYTWCSEAVIAATSIALMVLLASASPAPHPAESVEARIHREDNALIWRRMVSWTKHHISNGSPETGWMLTDMTKADDDLFNLCVHGNTTDRGFQAGVERGPFSYQCMQPWHDRGYTFDLKTTDMDEFNRLSGVKRYRIVREIAHYVARVYNERHPQTPHAIIIRICDTAQFYDDDPSVGSAVGCYERNKWALTRTFQHP
jgi:Phage integrase, N-terminal SAM-like domain